MDAGSYADLVEQVRAHREVLVGLVEQAGTPAGRTYAEMRDLAANLAAAVAAVEGRGVMHRMTVQVPGETAGWVVDSGGGVVSCCDFRGGSGRGPAWIGVGRDRTVPDADVDALVKVDG